jgi:hypothetical protein
VIWSIHLKPDLAKKKKNQMSFQSPASLCKAKCETINCQGGKIKKIIIIQESKKKILMYVF